MSIANAINRSIHNSQKAMPFVANIEEVEYVDKGGRVSAAPINFFSNQREQASSWTGITNNMKRNTS